MYERSTVFRGPMRAHTPASLPHLDFSLAPSRVDLRVRESRVVMTFLGEQGSGKWNGPARWTSLGSLRCVAPFVAACFALLSSNMLIASYCTLMILCSRWMHVG